MPQELLKLTDEHKLFCAGYVINLSVREGADNCGLSYGYCKQIVSKPVIQEYIQTLLERKNKRTGINADYVLNKLADMIEADPLDIMNDDRKFKPLSEWPLIWRQMLSSCDIKELYKDKEKIGEIIKAKFVSKEKILEMLGRHISVNAFQKDEMHLHLGSDITERLLAGRKRVEAMKDITPKKEGE